MITSKFTVESNVKNSGVIQLNSTSAVKNGHPIQIQSLELNLIELVSCEVGRLTRALYQSS